MTIKRATLGVKQSKLAKIRCSDRGIWHFSLCSQGQRASPGTPKAYVCLTASPASSPDQWIGRIRWSPGALLNLKFHVEKQMTLLSNQIHRIWIYEGDTERLMPLQKESIICDFWDMGTPCRVTENLSRGDQEAGRQRNMDSAFRNIPEVG